MLNTSIASPCEAPHRVVVEQLLVLQAGCPQPPNAETPHRVVVEQLLMLQLEGLECIGVKEGLDLKVKKGGGDAVAWGFFMGRA